MFGIGRRQDNCLMYGEEADYQPVILPEKRRRGHNPRRLQR
jgi:hypothetical protein